MSPGFIHAASNLKDVISNCYCISLCCNPSVLFVQLQLNVRQSIEFRNVRSEGVLIPNAV